MAVATQDSIDMPLSLDLSALSAESPPTPPAGFRAPAAAAPAAAAPPPYPGVPPPAADGAAGACSEPAQPPTPPRAAPSPPASARAGAPEPAPAPAPAPAPVRRTLLLATPPRRGRTVHVTVQVPPVNSPEPAERVMSEAVQAARPASSQSQDVSQSQDLSASEAVQAARPASSQSQDVSQSQDLSSCEPTQVASLTATASESAEAEPVAAPEPTPAPAPAKTTEDQPQLSQTTLAAASALDSLRTGDSPKKQQQQQQAVQRRPGGGRLVVGAARGGAGSRRQRAEERRAAALAAGDESALPAFEFNSQEDVLATKFKAKGAGGSMRSLLSSLKRRRQAAQAKAGPPTVGAGRTTPAEKPKKKRPRASPVDGAASSDSEEESEDEDDDDEPEEVDDDDGDSDFLASEDDEEDEDEAAEASRLKEEAKARKRADKEARRRRREQKRRAKAERKRKRQAAKEEKRARKKSKKKKTPKQAEPPAAKPKPRKRLRALVEEDSDDSNASNDSMDESTPSSASAASASGSQEDKAAKPPQDRHVALPLAPSPERALSTATAQPPQQPLFSGYRFALTGFSKDTEPTASALQSTLVAMGATVVPGVVDGDEGQRAQQQPVRLLAHATSFRTLKFVTALACGVPRLHANWALDSQAAGRLLDEARYELPAGLSLQSLAFHLPAAAAAATRKPAPKRSKHKHKHRCPLRGAQLVTAERAWWPALRGAGADVFARLEDVPAGAGAAERPMVVSDYRPASSGAKALVFAALDRGLTVVTYEWVLQSLIHGRRAALDAERGAEARLCVTEAAAHSPCRHVFLGAGSKRFEVGEAVAWHDAEGRRYRGRIEDVGAERLIIQRLRRDKGRPGVLVPCPSGLRLDLPHSAVDYKLLLLDSASYARAAYAATDGHVHSTGL